MPLLCCEAVPSDGLCSVLRSTVTDTQHETHVELRGCIPLLSCEAVKSHSLGMVLRNTLALRKHGA
jgi:hypothetical protein